MEILLTFIVFSICLAGMAIGLILAKRVLQRGCSIDPDSCACRKEGKDPSECSSG